MSRCRWCECPDVLLPHCVYWHTGSLHDRYCEAGWPLRVVMTDG